MGSQHRNFVWAVAVVSMLLDHLGAYLGGNMMVLRAFGRLAAPCFAWGIVEGWFTTRDHKAYALRLALVALAAEPFYLLLSGQSINMVFCLLLGLGVVAAYQWGHYYSVVAIPLASLYGIDWWVPACVFFFYKMWARPWEPILMGYTALVLLAVTQYGWVQWFALAAYWVIYSPYKIEYRPDRWVKYAVYPAHLAIIGGVKWLF